MRLLNLPSFAQEALSKGQINESQARLLLMVDDMREQQAIFNDLIMNSLSVRELRSRIKTKKEKPADNISFDPASSMRPKTDPEITSLEEQLMEILGTKVKVQSEGDGGKLMINFYSKEELQGLIEKLVQKRTGGVLHQEQRSYPMNEPISENLIEKVPKIEKLEKPEERLDLPNNEEKLLIERIPDPNPDDAPMIIRHDDEYQIPIRRGGQLSDDGFVV
jgi:hypothetical protein